MNKCILTLFALGSIASLAAAPISYQVTVNTSSIGASTPGFIEFQFNQANADTSLAATASVDNFTSTGFTFDNPSNFSLGGVSGSLWAPPLSFDNTGGATNLFDQGVSAFGSGFSFVLTLDGDALSTPSTDGSQLFLYILDADNNVLLGPGTGVAGVTINGDNTLTLNAVEGLSTIDAYTPGPTSTPEPSTFLLLGVGCAMAIFFRASRRPTELLKQVARKG